ncbi:MAG: Maf family protein [Thiobacillaceae bacterium]|nr:Maf family protein [Thiobacillaceae bacterium]MCX7672028.1 Maf family protein [Thiobacillaceae bacterium]MDW8323736.1 Maf family protein [Burkholderiales bacterium]
MPRSLYLASQSPRRLELLRQIGLTPTVLALRQTAPRIDVDETPLPRESARAYVQRVARAKAQMAGRVIQARQLPPWPVVAADTCVVLDGAILGKPRSAEEAAAWLRRYAERSHTVLTAVTVLYGGRMESAVNRSTVHFGPIGERDIAAYLASGEPFDKAGGYGIQGRAGAFVRHLSGSYTGVMGLPLYETLQLLKAVGFEPY